MTLQDVTVAVGDGNLGTLPEETDKIPVFLGASSIGAANTMIPINDSDGVTSGLGLGPLAEAVRMHVENSGTPCYAVPLTTTAGTKSAVTGGGGGPAVSVSGNPLDEYDVRVKITLAGALSVGKFQYSLDGGNTYNGADITLVASYVIPGSGLNLGFAAGTYILDAVYIFTTTAPSYTTGDVNTAMDVINDDLREFGYAHLVGVATGADDTAKATNSAAFLAAMAAKRDAAFNSKAKFYHVGVECPNVPDASLIAAFAAVANIGAWAGGGYCVNLSPITGRRHTIPMVRVAVSKIGKKPLGKDPSQVLAESGVGPLPSSILSLVRDERKTPSLDAQRFVTARTIIGKKGFYLTNWPLMSPTGSDFKYLQHIQCINNAAKVARAKLLDYLSRDLATKDDGTGQLTEPQAAAVDADVDQVLRASLVQPGHVQDLEVRAVRTDDVLTSERLRVKVALLFKAYPKKIELTVGATRSLSS